MEALQGNLEMSHHLGVLRPLNLQISLLPSSEQLGCSSHLLQSPPRPKAVTNTPNAKESNQQPASHHLQNLHPAQGSLGLASCPENTAPPPGAQEARGG